ncbi:lecithin retinol acyltransferase domain-containing protein [Ditylenchus destructor]|uniref:Lecithin retinol acyltransferase domain-containing protein n=1 Tax=Ditylenchus destructor TaxID=166010 RepID=A0AAD4R3W0_9BILA|nr:lecithin retinol acyltransferase domain-containing protein [Ditylenchus destructor]
MCYFLLPMFEDSPGHNYNHRFSFNVGTTASVLSTVSDPPSQKSSLAKSLYVRNWDKPGVSTMTTPAVRPSAIRSELLATTWQRAADLSPKLELGDLVEFGRNRYMHWGVYIGVINGIQCIAHISTDTGDFDDVDISNKKELSSKIMHGSTAKVRSDPFFNIAGQDLCRVNNYLDGSRNPFPPVIIRDRALYQLGSGNYNLLHNNCEHFAKWCRYGSRESNQATVGKTALIGVTALAITGSLPVALTVTTVGFACMKYLGPLHQAIVQRSFL